MKQTFYFTVLSFSLLANPSFAVKSCDGETVRTCARSIHEIESFEKKNEALFKENKIEVKKSLLELIELVNGKTLVYNSLIGDYTIDLAITAKKVSVKYNGAPIADPKICAEICTSSKRIVWYHPQIGRLTKTADGIRVGEYEFVVMSK
jgi:hypothetical protein